MLKFILITHDLSFLPDNILNCCQHIKISRPSKCIYNRCFKIKSNNVYGYQLQAYLKGVLLHLETSSSSLPPANSKIRYEHNLLRNFIKDYKQGKINPPFSNEIQLSDLPQRERSTRIVSFDPKVQIKKINKVCQSKTHYNVYHICLLYNVSLKEASLLQ